MDIYLPKWPQMLVTGKSVTINQAKDIIGRTDGFLVDPSKYSGGNNRRFNEAYRKAAGLERLIYEKNKNLDGRIIRMIDYDKHQQVKQVLGFIDTQYVHNSWASCSFIGGPHGWCHPSGKIAFVDNVGKWPSFDEILDDWKRLAEAFPYLDLHATLMSGESCYEDEYGMPNVPVVNIRVVNGTATQAEANITVHEQTYPRDIDTTRLLGDPSFENGLPTEWIQEYAKKVKDAIDEISGE